MPVWYLSLLVVLGARFGGGDSIGRIYLGGAVDRRCGHPAEVGGTVSPQKEEPGNVHDARKGDAVLCLFGVLCCFFTYLVYFEVYSFCSVLLWSFISPSCVPGISLQ